MKLNESKIYHLQTSDLLKIKISTFIFFTFLRPFLIQYLMNLIYIDINPNKIPASVL